MVILVAITSTIGNKRADAQSAANVLVVSNRASSASETIARYYVEHRGIAQTNVCAIMTVVTESITRAAYENQIENPIWQCIAAARAHDRILYIVLTKDVPLRISGTAGRTGTNSSVDSELTLLYRRRTGQAVPVPGFVPNPYFAGTTPIANLQPFSHRSHDIYLVTRLDGYTVQDAIGLVDKAASAAARGRFILDERAALIGSRRRSMASCHGGTASQPGPRRSDHARRVEAGAHQADRRARLLLVGLQRSRDPDPPLRHDICSRCTRRHVRQHRRQDVQGAARVLDSERRSQEWRVRRVASVLDG